MPKIDVDAILAAIPDSMWEVDECPWGSANLFVIPTAETPRPTSTHRP